MNRWSAVGLAAALLVLHQVLEAGLRAQAVVAPDQPASAGIVVEAVDPGSSGADAGVKPGDVLVSWSRSATPSDTPTARGSLRSPFDLNETEVEQAPRGAVTLAGIRDRHPLAVVMAPGPWGIASRPQMPPSLLATYEAGLRSLDAKAIEAAADLWRQAATAAIQSGAPETATWLHLRIAKALRPPKTVPLAADAHAASRLTVYQQAAETAKASADWSILPQVLEAQGDELAEADDVDGATEAYLTAMKARLAVGPPSLATTHITRMQVRVWRRDTLRGRTLDEEALATLRMAQDLLSRTLLVAQKQAPDSLAVVSILNEQALVAATALDLDKAAALQAQASALEAAKLPSVRAAIARAASEIEGIKLLWTITAKAFTNAGGNWISEQSNLLEVQRDLGRARQIFERLYPGCDQAARASGDTLVAGCRQLAHALNNLSMVELQRGDVSRAQSHLEGALAINTALAKRGIFDTPTASRGGVLDATDAEFDLTRNQNNLGNIALQRGDLDTAVDYFQAALDTRLACGARCAGGLSGSRQLLAKAELQRGDTRAARTRFNEVLASDEPALRNADPRFRNTAAIRAVAASHKGLGDVEYAEKHLAEARHQYQQALTMQRESIAESLDVADTLTSLAQVERDARDLPAAATLLRQALAIADKAAPDGAEVAKAAHLLGTVQVRMGDAADGEKSYARAVAALDTHTRRLGGAEEVRGRFLARRSQLYVDYAGLLVDQGRHAEAFQLLERSRAQSFRALLAERDLVFGLELPPDLDRERRANNAEHDRVSDTLRTTFDATQSVELRAKLRRLRDARVAIDARIRSASPRLASLQQPRALDLDETRGALDEGTLLLSYVVGDTGTLLFVVQPTAAVLPSAPGLSVFRLPIGRTHLEERARHFRHAIQGRLPPRHGVDTRPTEIDTKALADEGARLFDDLIRPAYRIVSASTRVLISADGPLHELPFAALLDRRAKGATSGRRYLVEWKPLHMIVSAAVYADLKQRPPAPARRGPAVDLGRLRGPCLCGGRRIDARRRAVPPLRGVASHARRSRRHRLPLRPERTGASRRGRHRATTESGRRPLGRECPLPACRGPRRARLLVSDEFGAGPDASLGWRYR